MIVVISARFTTPLATLSQAAVAISHGDLSVHTRPEGSRELQELSFAFNTMIARYKEKTS